MFLFVVSMGEGAEGDSSREPGENETVLYLDCDSCHIICTWDKIT